jgi:molybdenum cofactor biosynthesis enzyme MoaA
LQITQAVGSEFGNAFTFKESLKRFGKIRSSMFLMISVSTLAKMKSTISTTTNGSTLTPSRRRRWFEYPKSVTTFSIDAATPTTFELIRRMKVFDQVTSNLVACVKERKPGQVIRIHNNINKLNIHEVVEMVEFAAKSGVDEVEFNPTYHTPDICVDYHSAHAFAKAQQDIVDAAQRLGVKAVFYEESGVGLRDPVSRS